MLRFQEQYEARDNSLLPDEKSGFQNLMGFFLLHMSFLRFLWCMVNTVIVCFPYYTMYFCYLWLSRSEWANLVSACCAAFFSQWVSVMTGSGVRPTLGWYVLCLRPVLPPRAYGRRRWRFTRVLSPLPTNWAEANMLVLNSSDILMHRFVVMCGLKVIFLRFTDFFGLLWKC